MKRSAQWGSILLALCILAVMLALHFRFPEPVARLRLQVFDIYQRIAPRHYEPVPVRVVDIDEASISRLGQWPWPRVVLARMLDRLRQESVAVVGLDIIMSEPDRTSPEQLLPLWREYGTAPELDAGLAVLPSHDAVLGARVADTATVTGFLLTRGPEPGVPSRLASMKLDGPDPRGALPVFTGALTNVSPIDDGAVGIGAFNLVPDADGITRRLHLLLRLGGRVYPSFAAELVRAAQQAKGYEILAGPSSQPGGVGIEGLRIGALEVPTDGAGRFWIHHTEAAPQRVIPAWRVLAGDLPSELLRGNIVLVGSSAVALKDQRATPLTSVASGVELQASVVEQVMLGHFLRRPGWAEAVELIYLLGLAALLLALLSRQRALGCALVGAVGVATAVGASWYAFSAHRWLIDPILPSLAVLVVYVLASLTRFWQTDRERRYVRRAFARYLAPAVVAELTEDPSMLRLGGERRAATFLFTDIEGFTSLAENLEPEILVGLLNEYLDGCSRVVLAHGGTIDKIVGDAFHVMFNAPADQPDHADRAVRCALALDGFCRGFEGRRFEPSGVVFGRTRIGVNTGFAVVGNFGGVSRFDYTAHGDAINTAARLESLNRHLRTRICVSDATRALSSHPYFRPAGNFILKGKTEPMLVFEVTTATPEGYAPSRRYLEAWELMSTGAEDASTYLQALSEAYPLDPLVAFHARRLRGGECGAVVAMMEK